MSEPIIVRANTGLMDGIQSAARYTVVVITFIVAMLGLLKTRDIAGMIAYIQNNGGEVLAAVSGLVALGTAAYGVFKSKKRGDQIETVAADERVPSDIATLK